MRRGDRGAWVGEWRPSAVTLGAPAFPLFVLFGLNAVDELDRAGFAVLLPDIRDHFDLSNAGALAHRLAHDDRGAAHRGAAVLLLRPRQPGAHRHRRCRRLGAVLRGDRRLGDRGHAGHRPHRRRRRPGGRDADPLVAPVRLLRARQPGEGLLRPPPGQLGRPDPRAAASPGCWRCTSGGGRRSSSSPCPPSCSCVLAAAAPRARPGLPRARGRPAPTRRPRSSPRRPSGPGRPCGC